MSDFTLSRWIACGHTVIIRLHQVSSHCITTPRNKLTVTCISPGKIRCNLPTLTRTHVFLAFAQGSASQPFLFTAVFGSETKRSFKNLRGFNIMLTSWVALCECKVGLSGFKRRCWQITMSHSVSKTQTNSFHSFLH